MGNKNEQETGVGKQAGLPNVTPIYQHVDSSDVMTTGEVAKYLRCSLPTVRALAERSWHPLPCINTGNRTRKRRVFHRPSVLRWMQEEENIPVHPAAAKERRKVRK